MNNLIKKINQENKRKQKKKKEKKINTHTNHKIKSTEISIKIEMNWGASIESRIQMAIDNHNIEPYQYTRIE